MTANTKLSFLLCLLIATVSAQVHIQAKLSDAAEIVPGVPLALRCDANAVNLDSRFISVTNLEIKRQTNDMKKSSSIAVFNPYSTIASARKLRNIPHSRIWEVEFSPTPAATSLSSNTRALYVEARLKDADYDDAGLYECVIHFYDGPVLRTIIGQQNFSARVPDPTHEQEAKLSDAVAIVPGVPLALTCDANAVNLDSQHIDYNITYIEVKRQTNGAMEPIAVFNPYGLIASAEKVQNIPPGRNWEVEFSPDDGNTYVRIRLKDAGYGDAGMYECTVMYHDYYHGSRTRTAQQSFSARVPDPIHEQEAKLSDAVAIVPGVPLALICDANAVNLDSHDMDYNITYIEIKRQTDGAMEPIAVFNPYGLIASAEKVQNIPPGRVWEVEFSLYDGNMKVELRLKDAGYGDAGMYECTVMYHDFYHGSRTRTAQQSFSARAGHNP